MTLQSMLPYVAPPVVGAVIGYVTNDIAIRMLFRPLKPWRILGVRVPLTPGVIPAGRHEFATTIGRMVGTHLVTGADVAQALGKDAFRRELRETVSGKLDGLLDRELGPAAALVPAGLERWLRDAADLVRRQVTDGLFAHLEGEAFRGELAACVRSLEERVIPRELELFLEGERGERLRRDAGTALAALLHSRGVSRTVAEAVDAKVEEFLVSDRPLREHLPAEMVELVAAQIDEATVPLLERLGELLQTPEFRAGLEERLKEGLQGSLHNLKGALGFMAGLISVDKLMGFFPGLMGNVSEEIARWLREEETRHQVVGVVRSELDRLLDRPLAATLERLPYRRVAAGRRVVRRVVLGLVRSPATAELIVSLAERQGRRLLLDAPPGPLLERLVPEAEAGRLRESLVEWLAALLQAPESRGAAEKLVAERIEGWLFRTPLGRLSDRIPAHARRDLDDAVHRQVAELLEREVPPLVDAIDISRMVEEKINGLDLLAVERLLLDIMEKHFLYINLFGALLGFLMGFANVGLMALGWQ